MLFVSYDGLAIAAALIISLYWSDWLSDSPIVNASAWLLILALGVKLPLLYLHRLHTTSWRYVGIRDLMMLLRAMTLGSLILAILVFVFSRYSDTPPIQFFVPMDFLLSTFLIGGFRVSRRILAELGQGGQSLRGVNVLIFGAGSAGEQLVRAMQSDSNSTFHPIGFIDDDPLKRGTNIHEVTVLGTRNDFEKIVRTSNVEQLIIAMPSAGGSTIREITNIARDIGMKRILTTPPMVELLSTNVGLSALQELRPEDLLRRKQVTADSPEVEGIIRSASVLITGAGGSIGSELARQVARFSPRAILLFERDETSLFDIHRHLRELSPDIEIRAILGDIRDSKKVNEVLALHKPKILFHAAAYKHVPLMEENPADAISNNVIGTRVLAKHCALHEVERFVLISTDKAVNPTSVMGATKRLAESVIQEYNVYGPTRFMAVRFGNVLGSRGSVLPIFLEQVKNGGPVTVTHPEMQRYFMTSSEAVQLVLQAAAIGQGGEIFVLDMGDPVKIVDLARDMIHLVGKEPDVDIPIVFTGLRPGEKLFEDILTAEEGTLATKLDRIHVARMSIRRNGLESVSSQIDHLEASLAKGNGIDYQALLQSMVPTYSPSVNGQNGNEGVKQGSSQNGSLVTPLTR